MREAAYLPAGREKFVARIPAVNAHRFLDVANREALQVFDERGEQRLGLLRAEVRAVVLRREFCEFNADRRCLRLRLAPDLGNASRSTLHLQRGNCRGLRALALERIRSSVVHLPFFLCQSPNSAT